MVLHHQLSPRKRPAINHPFVPPKIPKPKPKPTTTPTTTNEADQSQRPQNDVAEATAIDKMVSLLADAGCTLFHPSGPPCLPSNPHNFRRHLHRLFSSSSNASPRSAFLSGFSFYVQSSQNLHRVLLPSNRDGLGPATCESLVRHLLLVPPIQLDLQNMLLEKLPEYFDINPEYSGRSSSLDEDVARLIVNHFRWLDFLVDSYAFTNKLMQVLSICPLHLKKEIIGSLPEIIGDQNNKTVVDSLEKMLQEDSAIIVSVLDSLSNLNLDDQLQEQVVTISLSCIRTIDAEHMPYLLRFLFLSATPTNVRRIISQIREQLKFVGVSSSRTVQHRKLKGKSTLGNTNASILDALRSSLRFKNMLCQEILKELKCIERIRDHKVIDIWLLMLIYMNGESLQKSVEKIFKKKIIEGCIHEAMVDQCIGGNMELVQDYFPSFLSLSEYLLACKEQKARDFGIHMYSILFEEFVDTYSRQEILGALVTHVGSGISFEVTSALDTMVLLVSKYAHELVPLSSHINGVLDYLEGFSVENLHKVYEVFSNLAISARSSANFFGSSIANELLMIVRKQVTSPDLKYKKMGLIGTLKIVSCLVDANISTCPGPSQQANSAEALELLKTSLDSCKQFPIPLILFYDELVTMLDCRTVQPAIVDWIGKHVGEFESMFLSDLEGGQLSVKDLHCGLEGELMMNLDGDISPICLNILPLVSSSLQSSSNLQILPANFVLLSTIERLANQGSLGGIDALLGCPLHLPSSKYFSGDGWQSLTGKQKHVVCLSLYYATNWIRELLNAFCTQVVDGRFACTTQATREETIVKLLKRLRNLLFLESLLNNSLKQYPLSLPELHLHVEHSGFHPNLVGHVEKKNEHKKTYESFSSNNKRKDRKTSKASKDSGIDGKLRQPTILDVLKKAGVTTSQGTPNDDSSALSPKCRTSESADQHTYDTNKHILLEVSAVFKVLETQRSKFRPLLVDCFSIFTFSTNQDSCCPDPAAELPLHLYLLRDIRYKLDFFSPPSKAFSARHLGSPPGLSRVTLSQFLAKIKPLFLTFKKHFNAAVSILKEGNENCEEHWKVQSASAGNPDIPNLVLSRSSVCTSVFNEILHCFNMMLRLADINLDKPILTGLLEAFQPIKMQDSIFSGLQPIPLPGTIEYLYCGAYSFVEDVLDLACSFSFMLASEALLTLESIVTSILKFNDKLMEGNDRSTSMGSIEAVLPTLRSRLGTSSRKILMHNWDNENSENGVKRKGEIVQRILQIYLGNSESTSDLLHELAFSILPQAQSSKTTEDDCHGFPTLCPATFNIWYRVLHEENLAILNKLVKEVVHSEKSRAGVQLDTVEELLIKLQKSANVLVSLVNMCRTQDKVAVHAMAVKYGGKFVDSFLKVFDFLQIHFQMHNELIIQLVKELQKATRTIQTLCSEAKGLKQTVITSKIPSTKRSMERFLFRVKALLHTSPSECTFWMGNLKHKDLMGQVVSSQAYMDHQNDNLDENPEEPIAEEQSAGDASEEDREL
ncbi:Fanconi anemia group D2 protein homolog [Vitis riparia]|uniref:Fanconi anemia group D2 protein homolog n=1 Tax=Vitis riparia TaxID=96939 RepID=UPI00155AE47D|nr:Fanconi anemia group D2 protein homolog [Vitis riparia]